MVRLEMRMILKFIYPFRKLMLNFVLLAELTFYDFNYDTNFTKITYFLLGGAQKDYEND